MTLFYSVIQFLFWFAYGTALSFSSVYLLACGLDNTMIGVISSAACALSVLLQPLLAAYADRERSLSIKTILLMLIALLLAVGVLLILLSPPGTALSGLLLGGAILCMQISLPMVNALAAAMINAGKKLNFSLARSFGSIGYAVMSFSVGRLAAVHGASVLPLILSLNAACLLIAVFAFPFRKAPAPRSAAPGSSGGVIAFLRRYPAFSAVLCGCALIYTGHVLINNFLYQIVTFKGGNSEHMGIIMGLAGLLEILTMVFFPTLLKWRKCSFWFRICGVFFTLKCLCTLLAGSMGAMYAVQLIQPLGWGLMTVASVYWANEQMAPQDTVKGQAYMTMSLSIGTIIGSLIGGWLIDSAGVSAMLIASILLSALGTGINLLKAK